MSSQREVLIRILALWQRKTLLETKNRTLKCLKRHYSTVQSMKNVAVLTEDGAFALCFRPHPGEFDRSRVPTPGNLPSKARKMLMPGVQPGNGGGGGRGWLDWCIIFSTESRDPFEKVSQHLKFFIVNESSSYGLKIRSCIVLKDAIAKKLCYERKSEFYICVFMSVSSSTYPPTAS